MPAWIGPVVVTGRLMGTPEAGLVTERLIPPAGAGPVATVYCTRKIVARLLQRLRNYLEWSKEINFKSICCLIYLDVQ